MLPSSKKKARRPWRRRVCLPPPEWSGRLYVRIAPGKVHMFRYLLEAEDNLGIMTVVDRWSAVLMVRFSPHQAGEMRAHLASMQASLEFALVELPSASEDLPFPPHAAEKRSEPLPPEASSHDEGREVSAHPHDEGQKAPAYPLLPEA